MATMHVLTYFVFSLMLTTVICQTFQYSRGWTNGKRSSSMLEDLVNSPSKNAGQLDNILVNCELQKMRLLLQGNGYNQLLQLPCEFFAVPKRSFPESMANVEHYRRQPPSINNNY
ncbi:PREDICTED: pro-corazonin-like [Dufourea novaeangliae]|uniref:Pro-corazonin n=1 Tax=Dufourea novaeangliae TaxID=178035 RepID=A0A154NX85_DUFNO|nr:PREDICTED: pro-corazonin-like [Dufourea novaeangliae]KZC04237.1 Pro-corazonin [Dufourea novaeangliae]